MEFSQYSLFLQYSQLVDLAREKGYTYFTATKFTGVQWRLMRGSSREELLSDMLPRRQKVANTTRVQHTPVSMECPPCRHCKSSPKGESSIPIHTTNDRLNLYR